MKKLADTLKSRETKYHLKVDASVVDHLDKKYSNMLEANSILICEVFKEYVMAQIKSGALISDIRLVLGCTDPNNEYTAYTSYISSPDMYDTKMCTFIELTKFFKDNDLNLIITDNTLYLEYA